MVNPVDDFYVRSGLFVMKCF